jgi:hypothetical protein
VLHLCLSFPPQQKRVARKNRTTLYVSGIIKFSQGKKGIKKALRGFGLIAQYAAPKGFIKVNIYPA